MIDTSATRHLDLGCGSHPRNPYRRDRLYGVDLVAADAVAGAEIARANVAVEPIPFPDNHFDSVSAYDFFEHVPQILPSADQRGTRFPFIELMNEVSRVLKPRGLLYAVTPCYPALEAFQDPTHVNILTDRSHVYFVGPQPVARMYGFSGHFELLRSEWTVFRDGLDPLARLTWRQRVRRFNYRRKGQLSHVIWEFRSSKPSTL